MNNEPMPKPNVDIAKDGITIMPEDCIPISQPMSLAMAYVPNQLWGDTYEIDVGFSRGTIFPGLDKPFIGEELPRR